MHKAIFWGHQRDSRGTWLKCHIPNEFIDDRLISDVMHGEIRVDDGRRISSDQRKKIYALINDISYHTGHHPEDIKEYMKYEFMIKEDRDYFSLSDVDMTTARYFIEYILEFCFEWEVPLSDKTIILTKEINNYLFLCLKYRRCAVCGVKAEIHHHEHLVGMGNDRKKHDHENSRFIALCWKHHSECHTTGHKTFEKKYKITPIKLKREIIKKLNI